MSPSFPMQPHGHLHPTAGKAALNWRAVRAWPAEMQERIWTPGEDRMCQLCKRHSVLWWTPDAVWNDVMAGVGTAGLSHVCLTCFTTRAESHGDSGIWQLFEPGYLR